MAEITVRFQTDQPEIDPAFFEELRSLAEPYGLRLAEEQHEIDYIPRKRKLSHEEFVRIADEISQRIGPVTSDSTKDIRELRDSR